MIMPLPMLASMLFMPPLLSVITRDLRFKLE